ncbi:MAG: hypothetical protein RIG61_12680 [Deltaproteobacteria bacterium]
MSKAKWLILFLLALSMAVPASAVELTLGGFPSYMRTRARFIQNATFISALTRQNAQDLGFNDNDDTIFFADTTLRLTPQLVLSDAVTIRAQLNVFDNNIWGGSTTELLGGRNTVVNSSLSFSDRFRGAILTGPLAIDDPGFFDVRMLHADIVLPHNLGFLRVGRQPFDWGIGILANGGWDPYSDLGFVLDRFLYLKSFAAGQSSITFVFVSDRFTQGNSVVTAQGDGWDGGAAALIFNHPNVGGVNLTLGGYVFPYIHQTNFASFPFNGTDPGVPPNAGAFTSGVTLDRLTLYSGLLDLKTDLWRLVGEIQGSWGEIAIDGAPDVDIDASNIIWAARAEVYPGWPIKMIGAEFGWAKGDDLSTDEIEGGVIFFNPAYNLDNLLFKHIIPNIYQVESSVFNAYYARAWGTVKLIDEISFTPQVVVAFNEETDNPFPGVDSIDTYMGTEVEGTLTWHIHPGVSLDLIGGVVFTGDSLETLLEAQALNTLAANDIDPERVNYDETPWTVQGRLMIFIDQFFK